MAYTPKSIQRLMKKQSFTGENICYITREEYTTNIHLTDGRVIRVLIPLGHFQDFFPQADFERINKDVLLRRNQVVNVKKGKYLMTDGACLEGRHHGTKCHKAFMQQMVQEQTEQTEDRIRQIREKYAHYDELPIPFCVIQLVFDVHGKGTTFIFRYCNKMMSVFEKKSVQDLQDRSFHEIFENASEGWLVKYGDIAQNGGRRVFHEINPARNKDVRILCYQAAPGFCACLVMEENWMQKLEELPQ